MDLTLAFVTDVHLGPEARFEGKLRKLSHRAPELLARFVEHMNQAVRPDAVVHLGDAIEDDDSALDAARYAQVVAILGRLACPVLHVVGNHDTVHLSTEHIVRSWGGLNDGSARAFYARDLNGYRLLVLHSHEIKDERVFVDEEQIVWLEAELRADGPPVIVLMHHSAADQVLVGNRWFEGRPHICLVQQRKRLRELFEASGRVLLVVNGHLHWNHLAVHAGIPYVTVQSLIENLDDDAPGRPAAGHAVVRVTRSRLHVEIAGEEPCRYQFARDF